jgi:hypothetical protein
VSWRRNHAIVRVESRGGAREMRRANSRTGVRPPWTLARPFVLTLARGGWLRQKTTAFGYVNGAPIATHRQRYLLTYGQSSSAPQNRNCSPPLNRRARCRRSIGRSVHAGRDFSRVPILVSTTSTENSSGSKPRSIHSDHPSTWERDGSAKAASKF